MDFYWKNNFHGVLGGSQDFFFFKCPRLFAPPFVGPSLDFNIITREYDVKGIGKSLGLNPAEFCLLGALLGNHILTVDDLSNFHNQLVPQLKQVKKIKIIHKLVKEIVYYIRGLSSVYNYEKIGHHLFGSTSEGPDPRVKKIKESMEYYFRGTLEGSRKHRKTEPLLIAQKLHSLPEEGIEFCSHDSTNVSGCHTLSNGGNIENHLANELTPCFDEKASISVLSESEKGPSVVNNISYSNERKSPAKEESHTNEDVKTIPIPYEVRRTATERHRLGAMSSYIYQVLCYGEIKFPVILENMKPNNLELPRIYEFYRPLRQYVYAILFNLHHHKFTRKQNQETKRTLESKISGLLQKSETANLSEEDTVIASEKVKKLKKDLEKLDLPESHEVKIREWLPYNSYQKPCIVEGVEVPWGVPTVQRLWFGTSMEDKEKRIRAFMSCMRCDDVKPLLLQPHLIPPNFVFMACILRYIMVSSNYPVLKKSELDVFLLTSLQVGTYSDPSQLDAVTPRGVQLASLFMEGVEMALFANDACGAPFPLHMTLPWTFFDGVLFHMYLQKAASVQNLYELCDNDELLVSRVEIMKSVIIPELMNNEYLIRYPKRNIMGENGYYGFLEGGRSFHKSNFLHPGPFPRGKAMAKKKVTKGKPFSYNESSKKSYTKKTERSTMKKKFLEKVNDEEFAH
ncbi:constitutive coactivator of PPAR-gamma-like protein 1 homolog [Lepeophtheirus salmonis]|uniref:constitutive coactivator of PPAR-gamma-like protein 1 homolog n=1 Tax=Lepeophtheirus salmonis TaxID=72036 RepID=UPI001AE6F977|nr:constitutive coactivator of PPAR-gamma-like protein 2 [Lepeophtheirus salmonis]XP_040569825.1 constitutive coactivator of PPAR-gamma-like protein 2 [Lepeophtheirus salmonis]